MPMRCDHVRNFIQFDYHAFECKSCGRVFFGIERKDPMYKMVKDYLRISRNPHNPLNPIHSESHPREHIHVDLGTMPQDIIFMKAQIDQMEKSLSNFSEIIRDALQT